MTAVALRAVLLTHPPTPSQCPRLRYASLRGLGHPRMWMGTESGRHEPLRAPLPLRGACWAPLPLRAVGTFLRFERCGPRWGLQLFYAPKRAYPHSAPAQPSNPHSAPAQPFAPHALFLPPLTPLRGEGEIGRWGLSVLPFATTLRPDLLGSASLLRVASPTPHAFSTPPAAPLRGAVS